ncbi:MAG: DUF1445 domain-containing protein [Chloroflexi bacterium]|nr:DUF1445 domain-containing protein [Chloroflexota bacterium]
MSPEEFRSVVRQGKYTGTTHTCCRGYARTNLVIVPREYAFDFSLFCHRNPGPCPVLDVTDPGDPHPKLMAPDADLRTDLPQYRVFKDGQVTDEPTDISKYWREDLVAFLFGCAASVRWAFEDANVRHRTTGVYRTTIRCVPAGRFYGPMAVTCTLVRGSRAVVRSVQIGSRHLFQHGPPIHIGDPAAIGIQDLCHPDLSGSPNKVIAPQEPDEVALFWACGVTPQLVALEAKVPFMITHYPAHMFVTDHLAEELAVL